MFRAATITHPVVVNDGKPFDACKGFLTVRKTEESVTNEELELAQCIVIFQHAKALNPPIKVTQAVLKAMQEVPEAKFKVKGKYPINESFIYYSCFYEDDYIVKDTVIRKKGWYYWSFVEYPHSVVPSSFEAQFAEVKIGDYIQADCPLALQVLLGFTTEGV
jgi:hypothetical protein